MIGWIILLAFLAFFVYYGYHLFVQRAGDGPDGGMLTAACHLCKQKYPVNQMVARDKDAGFVNYFCGDCIEKLYADLKRV